MERIKTSIYSTIAWPRCDRVDPNRMGRRQKRRRREENRELLFCASSMMHLQINEGTALSVYDEMGDFAGNGFSGWSVKLTVLVSGVFNDVIGAGV